MARFPIRDLSGWDLGTGDDRLSSLAVAKRQNTPIKLASELLYVQYVPKLYGIL